MKSDRNQKNNYDVIVIGGGASGMMAAGRAGELGKKVLLVEKNDELGKKLSITGGGRCNITNAEFDVRKLLSNFGKASVFLFSPFSKFGVKESFDFFEKLELPLIVQENNRAFPKTEKATDVVKVLVSYLKKNKVTILNGKSVSQVLINKNKISGIIVDNKKYEAKSYVLATGGLSHPETGSTGDGLVWLKNLGHTIQAPTPSLTPLKTKDKWGHQISGVSLQNAKVTFYVNEEKKFSKTGKMIFTHFGISGPVIINSAKKVSDLLHEGKVIAKIDLFEDKNIGELNKYITGIFDKNKNKTLKNVLKEIVPKGMSSGISMLLDNINLSTKVHSVNKEERRHIIDLLKALPLNIVSLMGNDRSIVSDGGLSLDEIDTKNMSSKICKNLFVTGDLLNINRPSGGYSLQLCWTTGWVAGSNA